MPGKTIEIRGDGKQTVRDLTRAEEADRVAMAAEADARAQAEATVVADMQARRATIIADLQGLAGAATWAIARPFVARLLVFILRRLGERDT